MASPHLSSQESPVYQAGKCSFVSLRNRIIAAVLIVSLPLRPVTMVVTAEEYPVPSLPTLVSWDPLPVSRPNPFVWPPPAKAPLLSQVAGTSKDKRPFPAFQSLA